MTDHNTAKPIAVDDPSDDGQYIGVLRGTTLVWERNVSIVDAGDPIVADQAYGSKEIFAITIPLTPVGAYTDKKSVVATNGVTLSAMFLNGGVAPSDPANITPAEFAEMEIVDNTREAGTKLAKNVLDFTTGDLTLDCYQLDLSAGIDGTYYPNIDADAEITLPSLVGVNDKVIKLALDWTSRRNAVPVPNWITDPDTNADIVGGPGLLSLSVSDDVFPGSGHQEITLTADTANNRWIVSQGSSVGVAGATAETDTLATVTGRGNIATGDIEVPAGSGIIMTDTGGERLRLRLAADDSLETVPA